MPVVYYDSLGEFCRALPETDGDSPRSADARRACAWNGNQTYAEAKQNIWRGDEDTLASSEKLLDRVDADGIELTAHQWDHDRTGFIPCIPSYLAGSPESMRRLTEAPNESAPVRIFVDACLSYGFSGGELSERGTAILALARKLQSIRPVELWLFGSMHGKRTDDTGECAIPVIRIDTNPMDLTTVSYAMGNAGFLRQLCFNWGFKYGFTGQWAWNGNPSSNRARLIEVLGVGEQDLIIDGGYLSDELMKRPLDWINGQIKRYTGVLEDAG